MRPAAYSPKVPGRSLGGARGGPLPVILGGWQQSPRASAPAPLSLAWILRA